MARDRSAGGGDGARRLIRAGLVLALGWIALEIALANLVADRIGWGATIALLAVKGGAGLLLVGLFVWRGLKRLRNSGQGLVRSGVEAGFCVASAVLVALPGLMPALLGIALFSPTLRLRVLAWLRPVRAGADREIDLSASEWREIRTRRKRAPQGKRDPSLEGRPPSV